MGRRRRRWARGASSSAKERATSAIPRARLRRSPVARMMCLQLLARRRRRHRLGRSDCRCFRPRWRRCPNARSSGRSGVPSREYGARRDDSVMIDAEAFAT